MRKTDYKRKYLKYKSKYLSLKREYNAEEYIDDDQPDIEYIDLDQHAIDKTRPFYLESDEQDRDTILIKRLPPQEEDKNEPEDIGVKGLARIIEYERESFSDDQFITLQDVADKSKILHIKTVDDFDEFTAKYGDIGSDDDDPDMEYIFIYWNKVANDYKGFYLEEFLNSDRFEEAPFKDQTTSSWWSYEYDPKYGVIIFQTIEMMNGKKITKPFNGTINTENFYPKNKFIFSNSKNSQKILCINSLNEFDKFTNEYGEITKENNIRIIWSNVQRDYAGFYIDKDNEKIYVNRYAKAFYEDKRYTSWLKYEKIIWAAVYTFK